jgi:hypothetical protein
MAFVGPERRHPRGGGGWRQFDSLSFLTTKTRTAHQGRLGSSAHVSTPNTGRSSQTQGGVSKAGARLPETFCPSPCLRRLGKCRLLYRHRFHELLNVPYLHQTWCSIAVATHLTFTLRFAIPRSFSRTCFIFCGGFFLHLLAFLKIWLFYRDFFSHPLTFVWLFAYVQSRVAVFRLLDLKERIGKHYESGWDSLMSLFAASIVAFFLWNWCLWGS